MRLLVVLASFPALIGLAVPAHGDAGGYLAELDQAGVSYRDPTDATNSALSICQGLNKGDSFDTEVDSQTAAGYNEHEAGFIVGAAVRNLCPDLLPAMDEWVQNTTRDPKPLAPQRTPSYLPLPGEAGG